MQLNFSTDTVWIYNTACSAVTTSKEKNVVIKARLNGLLFVGK